MRELADKYCAPRAEIAAPVVELARPKMHIVIPDVQTKADVPNHHLEWVGNYLVEKKPDVVVCIGDFADMPSLSSYDRGKRAAENQRYQYDIEAARDAMEKTFPAKEAASGGASVGGGGCGCN